MHAGWEITSYRSTLSVFSQAQQRVLLSPSGTEHRFVSLCPCGRKLSLVLMWVSLIHLQVRSMCTVCREDLSQREGAEGAVTGQQNLLFLLFLT